MRLRRRSAPLFRSQLLGWRRLGADVRCGVLRFAFGCRVFCGIGRLFARDASRVNFGYVGGRVVGWIRHRWISRRSFDPLGPVVLFWVHCCWGSKPACSNRLQVSGRMLLRPSSPAGVSRNELHFSLFASFRLCGASCVVGLVVCEQSRAAGRLPGISPSNPAAVHVSPYFVCAWWLRIHRRHCQTGF